MNFQLTSKAFQEGSPIPSRYTCDAEDISPALMWTTPPEGTASLTLICDDPDDQPRPWAHWLIYNIPPSARGLPEGMSKEPALPDGILQGLSDFNRTGYGGPCPPSGTHHYAFKLYALDTVLKLPANATKPRLDEAMKGHVLAQTQLMGTYIRQPKR